MLIRTLLLIILIGINGLLSASEIAYLSIDKYAIEKKRDKKSKKMEKLGDRLIGNAASAVERKIINSILKKIF